MHTDVLRKELRDEWDDDDVWSDPMTSQHTEGQAHIVVVPATCPVPATTRSHPGKCRHETQAKPGAISAA